MSAPPNPWAERPVLGTQIVITPPDGRRILVRVPYPLEAGQVMVDYDACGVWVPADHPAWTKNTVEVNVG